MKSRAIWSEYKWVKLSYLLKYGNTTWHLVRLRDFFFSFLWSPICFSSTIIIVICQEIVDVIQMIIETFHLNSIQNSKKRSTNLGFLQLLQAYKCFNLSQVSRKLDSWKSSMLGRRNFFTCNPSSSIILNNMFLQTYVKPLSFTTEYYLFAKYKLKLFVECNSRSNLSIYCLFFLRHAWG